MSDTWEIPNEPRVIPGIVKVSCPSLSKDAASSVSAKPESRGKINYHSQAAKNTIEFNPLAFESRKRNKKLVKTNSNADER